MLHLRFEPAFFDVRHRRCDKQGHKAIVTKAPNMLLPYKGLLRTITPGNGKVFAEHTVIAESLGVDYYFAIPTTPGKEAPREHERTHQTISA